MKKKKTKINKNLKIFRNILMISMKNMLRNQKTKNKKRKKY